MHDVDLAIVGGGPAGVATALFLAAAAAGASRAPRVVVLEKERYPREKICAGAIGARADKALASIGVSVDVPAASVCGLSVAGRHGFVRERLDAPIGRVVRRVEFDAAFAAVARSRGVVIEEGARVTSIDREGDGVRLTTSVGDVMARAIVGADGVGSFVRRTLGFGKGRFTAQVVEVDTEPVDADLDRAFLHFDLNDAALPGYAWDFPTVVGGRALVCRGVYELRDEASVIAEGDGADVGARLAARLERQGAKAVSKVKRFAERGLALHEPTAAPRALLVGEAAGIDPVLGEGIAQAILYGAVAGPYLAARLEAGDLAFEDWAKVLHASRVGFDLRVRARAAELAYGPRREAMERWVTSSRDLAIAGMRYFAGERVPRWGTARAMMQFAGALLR
ncbi:MAG TPA: NAD(P)/FAD-dependent oxidoreductase [Byssovorax sp.]|jgi:flavin-dependent dehydrogenase